MTAPFSREAANQRTFDVSEICDNISTGFQQLADNFKQLGVAVESRMVQVESPAETPSEPPAGNGPTGTIERPIIFGTGGSPSPPAKSIEPYLDAVLNEAERVHQGQGANIQAIRNRVEMIRNAKPEEVKQLVQVLTGEVSALAEDGFDTSSLLGVMSKLVDAANASTDGVIVGDVDVKPDLEG